MTHIPTASREEKDGIWTVYGGTWKPTYRVCIREYLAATLQPSPARRAL